MRSRLFALWGATALLAGSGIAAPVGAQASGEQVFEFTGEVATFVVPDDVCRITIDAYGASGGAGALGADPVTPGGLGARATGTIDVTPGEPLAIVVGGAGGDAAEPLPGRGGFGGGGDGGYGVLDGGGGGGGGAMGGGGGAGMTSNGGGGGGGGSSAGPAGTVFETGVREGDGLITLTWVVGDGCPPVPPDSTAPPADAAEPTPSDPARPPAEGVTAPARGAAPVRALPTYAG